MKMNAGDRNFLAYLDKKYEEYREFMFDSMQKEMERGGVQPEAFASVVALLRVAGEVEVMIDQSYVIPKDRIDIDAVYGIYTEGYNAGFEIAQKLRAKKEAQP